MNKMTLECAGKNIKKQKTKYRLTKNYKQGKPNVLSSYTINIKSTTVNNFLTRNSLLQNLADNTSNKLVCDLSADKVEEL